MGYNTEQLTKSSWADRPKGCVIGDADNDDIYTESYFNIVSGHAGARFKSICFTGIYVS